MSHTQYFEIPARIDFRPFRFEWRLIAAEFVGWRTSRDPYLKERALGLLKDKSLYDAVEIRIPTLDDREPCIVSIERMFLPREFLAPHENPKNTPDFNGRTIEILASHLSSSEIPESSSEPLRDAWEMRTEYFGLEEENSESLCAFLNQWGLWGRFFRTIRSSVPTPSKPVLAKSIDTSGSPWLALVLPHRFWQERAVLRKALLGSSRNWLSSGSSFNFDATREIPFWLGTNSALGFKVANEPPFCILERSYCQEAVRTTISIDHIEGASFGICKRKDCRKLFERTTKQKRLYCSPECAHLANVRKLRAEQKSSDLKREGNARNAKG